MLVSAMGHVADSLRRSREIPAGPGAKRAHGRRGGARKLLDDHGAHDVQIEAVPGGLTDHYDPRSRVLRLSSDVWQSRSVAALGVAAHEAGHALQHAQGYGPIHLRAALVPIANIGSNLSWIIFFLGLIFGVLDADARQDPRPLAAIAPLLRSSFCSRS